jgi:hypothetical protein
MLEDPQQFRSTHAAEQAGDRRVHAGFRKTCATELATEHPQPDECAERNQRAEAGDFEGADPKKNGVDVPSCPMMSRRSNDFA